MKSLQAFNVQLNAEIENIKNGTLQGLVKAAAKIRHETEHTYPATPRRLGNLVNSWFVVTAKKVHKGQSPEFKGVAEAKFMSEHMEAIAEKQGEAAAQTTKDRKLLIMGYSANYAGFLHESIVVKKFTPRKPPAGLKWFEHHFKANKDKILQIIAKEVKIPK
jgi:hypothetical protein